MMRDLKIPRFAAVAAAILLAMGTTACSSSSSGSSEHSFEGSSTGTAQFGGEGNHDGLVNAKACNEDLDVDDYYKVTTYTSSDGTETKLGKVHIETAHCNSEAGPQQGQIAFVVENGDVLFGEYVGGGDVPPGGGDPTQVTFMATTTQDQCYLLNDVACQSTGQFENASGTVTWVGLPEMTDESDPFIPWSFRSTWTGGTVTY